MRPRADLGLAAGLMAVLAVGAAMLGSRRAKNADTDPRRSSYLTGPNGASGWAEALGRLGVQVERFRRPALSLGTMDREAVFAVLGPTRRLDAREGAHLAALPGDLLLAGEDANAAISCLGYRVSTRWSDLAVLKAPPGAEERPMPRARAELARHRHHHRGLVRRLRRPADHLQRPRPHPRGHRASDDQRSAGCDPDRLPGGSDGDSGGR